MEKHECMLLHITSASMRKYISAHTLVLVTQKNVTHESCTNKKKRAPMRKISCTRGTLVQTKTKSCTNRKQHVRPKVRTRAPNKTVRNAGAHFSLAQIFVGAQIVVHQERMVHRHTNLHVGGGKPSGARQQGAEAPRHSAPLCAP